MGRYSDLAIELGIDYDVPGTLCERDLMRAPKGETPAQRWLRLARLAVVQGCRLVTLTDERGTIRVGVTSGTAADTVYRINLDTMRCECAAHKACKHLAFALMCVDCLPIEPPHHVARSAAVARSMRETLEVAA